MLQEDTRWENWLQKFQSLSIERLQPRIGIDLIEQQFGNDGIAKTQKFAYDVHEALIALGLANSFAAMAVDGEEQAGEDSLDY